MREPNDDPKGDNKEDRKRARKRAKPTCPGFWCWPKTMPSLAHFAPFPAVVSDLRPLAVLGGKVAPAVCGPAAGPLPSPVLERILLVLTPFHVGVAVLPAGELAAIVHSLPGAVPKPLPAEDVARPLAGPGPPPVPKRVLVLAPLLVQGGLILRRGLLVPGGLVLRRRGGRSRRTGPRGGRSRGGGRRRRGRRRDGGTAGAREEDAGAGAPRKCPPDNVRLLGGDGLEVQLPGLDGLQLRQQRGVGEVARFLVSALRAVAEGQKVLAEGVGLGDF